MDTLSTYLFDYLIEFTRITCIIEKNGGMCQNARFSVIFTHCVEVFEEMVTNWRMRVIYLKSVFNASPDSLCPLLKYHVFKKI